MGGGGRGALLLGGPGKLFFINRAVALMKHKTTMFLPLVLNGVGHAFSISVKKQEEEEHILVK